MIFPVNIIAKWLIGRGMKEANSGPVAWVLAIGLAILFLSIGWAALKAWVIDDHKRDARAERAEQVLERTGIADRNERTRRERDEAAEEELEKEATNARIENPEAAGQPVGPVTSSVHDGLRRQREP